MSANTPEQHGSGPKHYSACLSDTVLELYPAVELPTPIRIGLRVADVATSVTAVRSFADCVLRFEPEQAPNFALLRDPDGNKVELVAARGTGEDCLCTVWNLETGFFVRGAEQAPAAQGPAFSARIVPDIDEVTQFFRVRVDVPEPLAGTSEVWVIFLHVDGRASAAPPAANRAEANQRLTPLRAKLLAALSQAKFCFVVDDREGYARVIDPEPSPIAFAAAVAVVKYSAAWDESNPIVVSAGNAQFDVSVAFTGDRYLATVR